jgi:hypothetical protein
MFTGRLRCLDPLASCGPAPGAPSEQWLGRASPGRHTRETRAALCEYDDPGQASDEALATAFGDITDELARRGADAFLLAFKATSNDALDKLLVGYHPTR